jgi:hypothetical protein
LSIFTKLVAHKHPVFDMVGVFAPADYSDKWLKGKTHKHSLGAWWITTLLTAE